MASACDNEISVLSLVQQGNDVKMSANALISRIWNAKDMAIIFGVTLIAAGFIGFIPNGFAGPGAIFEANTPHNFVHIVTGSIAIIAAMLGFGLSALWGLSIFYIGFTTLNFFAERPIGYVCSVIKVNYADNFLHGALMLLFLSAAVFLTASLKPARLSSHWPSR
jgi:hypothetical protein